MRESRNDWAYVPHHPARQLNSSRLRCHCITCALNLRVSVLQLYWTEAPPAKEGQTQVGVVSAAIRHSPFAVMPHANLSLFVYDALVLGVDHHS